MGGLVPQLYGSTSADGVKVEQVYCGLKGDKPGSVAVVTKQQNPGLASWPPAIVLDGETFTFSQECGKTAFAQYFKPWGEEEKAAAKVLKSMHPDYL